MRIKTIITLVIVVLLTIILMQNREPVRFTILFGDFIVSKLLIMLIVAAIAFLLGWLVGRPGRIKRLGDNDINTDTTKTNTGTLSDKDRDYLN